MGRFQMFCLLHLVTRVYLVCKKVGALKISPAVRRSDTTWFLFSLICVTIVSMVYALEWTCLIMADDTVCAGWHLQQRGDVRNDPLRGALAAQIFIVCWYTHVGLHLRGRHPALDLFSCLKLEHLFVIFVLSSPFPFYFDAQDTAVFQVMTPCCCLRFRQRNLLVFLSPLILVFVCRCQYPVSRALGHMCTSASWTWRVSSRVYSWCSRPGR